MAVADVQDGQEVLVEPLLARNTLVTNLVTVHIVHFLDQINVGRLLDHESIN